MYCYVLVLFNEDKAQVSSLEVILGVGFLQIGESSIAAGEQMGLANPMELLTDVGPGCSQRLVIKVIPLGLYKPSSLTLS